MCVKECLCSSFPGSVGSCLEGCRQSCVASAHLHRHVQHGCFPSNLTGKLQWMATFFYKRFARSFAILPNQLCIALFSNRCLTHGLSRYLLQIPALGMLWDQSHSMLHLLSSTLSKIWEFRALSTLQDQGQVLDGNLT